MADVKKSVEVEIKLKGLGGKELNGLAAKFTEISEGVNKAVSSLNSLKTALDSIKVPETLNTAITSLKELATIKTPNVEKIARGLKELSEVKKAPDLDKFIIELKKFSGITLPNVKQIAQGLRGITDSSVNMSDVGSRLRNLHRNLKRFSEINLPNLPQITKGLKEFNDSSINMGETGGRLRVLYRNLKNFSEIKLPNLTVLAKGLRAISDSTINMSEVGSRLRVLYRNLKNFSEIKLPNVSALVNGFTKLAALQIGPIAAKILALNAAIKQLDKAGHLSSFNKFAADLTKVSAAVAQTKTKIDSVKKALNEAGNSADNAGRRFRSFSDKIQTYFQYRLIADGVAVLKNAASEGAKAILEYDQSLKDLQAITGATGLQVEQMGTKIKQVASDTKFSASEVAAGMRTLGQAGFTASESIETMQAVSDLATGTLSDMSTTVDLVTTAMRVFRIESSRSSEVADVFGNAVNRSKLTIDKLRTAMNYVGPVARDIGISFKEMSASMGLLANSGLRASTVGTGLRRVFAELADPSEKLQIAARNAGVALEELNPRTQGLEKVIQNLGLVVNDSAIAFDIFGKRGAAAVLALSGSGSGFKEMLDTIGQSGTAAAMAATQMEGLGVSFKNLQDKLGLLAITLGEAGISGIFRVLIDLSRDLVDLFISLASTTIGKFIISLGLVTASVYALILAFVTLKGILNISMFRTFIANAGQASVAMKGLSISIAGFTASAGVILVVVTAIVVAIKFLTHWLNEYKKASDEATIAADDFGRLNKAYQDYAVDTATLVESSEQHLNANKKLRLSLLETSKGMTEISDEALKAANSISPLTGEIRDGEAALKAYNEELGNLKLEKVVEASENSIKNLERQSSAMSITASSVIDLGKQVGTFYKGIGNSVISLLDGNTKQAGKYLEQMANDMFDYDTRATKALDWSQTLENGTVDFQKFSDFINSMPLTGLTSQEKKLKATFASIEATAKKSLGVLEETGKIDFEDTTKNILKIAESSGITGVALEAVKVQLLSVKEALEGTYTSPLEKWIADSNDMSNNVGILINDYGNLGGAINEVEKSQIEASEARKTALANDLDAIRKVKEAALAAGEDQILARIQFQQAKLKLEKDFNEVNKQLSDNELLTDIQKYAKIEQIFSNTIDELNAKLESANITKPLYAQRVAEANLKYEEDLHKLISKIISPKEIIKTVKEATQILKLEGAEQNKELEIQVHKGLITRFDANVQILKNNEDTAKKVTAIWIKAEQDIVKETGEDGKFAKKAKSSRLSSELAESKAITNATKEKSKLVAIEQDHVEDLIEINEKYTSDLEKASTDRTTKIFDIERDLKQKLHDLNLDALSITEEFNAKRLENAQSLASDLAGISSSTEDKIRAIRQRGLSDSEKDNENEKVALAKITEAHKLIAQARLTGDSSALSRGQSLLSQAESLASSLGNQGAAINLLEKAEKELKTAKNVEGALRSNEDILKQQEKMAANVKKIRDAERTAGERKGSAEAAYEEEVSNINSAAKKKLQGIENAYTKATDFEGQRHNAEMSNLDAEIAKYEAKLAIVKSIVDITSSDSASNEYTIKDVILSKSDGGLISKFAKGGVVQKFANGGFARRAKPYINEGSKMYDSVKALLMRGEYIIKRSAVEKFGVGFFDSLNAGINPILKMATGGLVGNMPKFATDSGSNDSRSESTVNLNLSLPVPGKPIALTGSRTSVNELIRQLEQMKRLGQ